MDEASHTSWNDRSTLREQQYRDEQNLVARQSIYDYQRPRLDLPTVVLDAVQPSGDETVLDIGCGNGAYLTALRRRGHRGPVVGVDLSAGMLAAARARSRAACLTVGDVMRLPIADGCGDLVLAMHMLYHAPDPAAAIRELRRVTRPEGRLVVVLNGDDHLHQLRRIMAAAGAEAGSTLPMSSPLPFTLETGEAALSAVFPSLTRLDLEAELVVPTPAPVLAYVRSTIGAQQGTDWDAIRAAVARQLPEGEPVRITTHTGVFICR